MTPHPFPLHFSGPAPLSATVEGNAIAISFKYADGMYLNDTAGCEIHRGIDFHGNPIGGDCCKAHDTFQLCTGDIANTTELVCVNATSVTIGAASVMISATTQFTSVRYAYANYPQCALYNVHGLPAGPFVMEIGTPSAVKDVVSTAVKTFEPPAMTPPMGVNR
jgi:hypothetical protein